jgi:hypothetical protein
MKEGATPALLGKRPTTPNCREATSSRPRSSPTSDNSMRIAQEEIFGPVLCVIKYDGEDEAVRMANDTIYGLAAGVWSRDTEHALSVAKRIRAGTVWINDYHLINAEAPLAATNRAASGASWARGVSRSTWRSSTSTCRSTTSAAASSGSTSSCHRRIEPAVAGRPPTGQSPRSGTENGDSLCRFAFRLYYVAISRLRTQRQCQAAVSRKLVQAYIRSMRMLHNR